MSWIAKHSWLRYAIFFLLPAFIAYNYRHTLILKESRQILPTHVRPFHYDLALTPNLVTFNFDGTVKINLEILTTTNTIVLNTRDIQVHNATVYAKDTKEHEAIAITYDVKKDEAAISFAQELPAQSQAVLEITFSGILNDQMAGFYRSTYRDAQGNTHYLATTQFEATSARRAFPCWDEPSIKATFDVTLTVPHHLVALSNMDVAHETMTDSGHKRVGFETTPVMSTYLLAFAVGPFEYIEAYSSGEHNGQPIRARVYTLPGLSEQGRHALNVCTTALEYFAGIFGQPYPLPKIDMVAIPDFEAGAMENWGLITYRTVLLLFDDASSSITSKKNVAYVVCHELAHQWFGNLVTMEWWEHLWLNEGFATWVGWLAVDSIFPDWDIWTSFVSDEMPNALRLDSLRSSHPIEVAVYNPSDIHQIFDAISYSKSASVIRMLSSWLGKDTFLSGVRRYLQRHKFGNAATNDLWASLSEETGLNVSQFMAPWTRRVGYPVLTVSRADSIGAPIEVRQSRYLSTGDLSDEEDSSIWWIPLDVLLPDKVESYTLTAKQQSLDLDTDTLFKLNAGQTGLYRVSYPMEMIQAFGEEIKKGDKGLLSAAADRIGLISDTSSLCVSGEQSTIALLELVQAFENEQSYFVWSQLQADLAAMYAVWYDIAQARDGINTLRRHLFGPLAKRIGWGSSDQGNDFTSMLHNHFFAPLAKHLGYEVSERNDDDLKSMLRALAIENAGLSGHKDTIIEAKLRFWKYVEGDINALDPNLRGVTYSTVLHNAQDQEEEQRTWQEIYQIYDDRRLPEDQRLSALRALAAAKSPSLTKRLLEMSLDKNLVRGQDSIIVFSAVSAFPQSREVLWEFFKENYDLLHSSFAQSLSLYASLVRSVVRGAVTHDMIGDMEVFFSNKDTKEYGRALEQAMETAKMRSLWLERDRDSVTSWLQDYLGVAVNSKQQ